MDVWETIRIRCRRNGEKIKTVARDLGLAPNTVRGYLRKESPPKRKPRTDVKTLTRYQSHIDNLILSTPKITAARIGSYLRQNVDSDLVADERTLRRERVSMLFQERELKREHVQRVEYQRAHPELAPQIAGRDIAQQKPPAPEVARKTGAEYAADLAEDAELLRRAARKPEQERGIGRGGRGR
jgi:hypothetical protein